MLENWKNALVKCSSVCVAFMDLSKASDTINQGLLLAKFKAYSFSKDLLSLMCSYRKYRKQRVAIKNSTSTTKIDFTGVPQGSIDDPLLFNILINDLGLFIQYEILGNYTDGNNIHILPMLIAAFGL